MTLVNCEKFAAADGHVFQGGVREAAKLAHVYAEATTPKVAVIVGKAYGSACVALAGRGANADYAIAWPNAVISALAPETAVAFLEGDKITLEKSRAEVEAEYLANEASALAAAARGHIDDVVDPQIPAPRSSPRSTCCRQAWSTLPRSTATSDVTRRRPAIAAGMRRIPTDAGRPPGTSAARQTI
ncbi:MAG: carboxyl transferase domain-containing protein [Anaerotruncus massiliensis (ex Togo et al. 2019)]